MKKNEKKSKQLRSDILKTAQHLFVRTGYEKTTVRQVIDELGVSKGAFYHYFSSKENLLDAVIEKMTLESVDALRPVLLDRTLPAPQRLVLFMAESRKRRMSRMPLVGELMRVLSRDENAIIRQKINRRMLEAVQPLLTGLIADGVKEGAFDTPDPDEASAMLLYLGQYYAETTAELLLSSVKNDELLHQFKNRIDFTMDAYERLLGMKPGDLPRPDVNQIRQIFSML